MRSAVLTLAVVSAAFATAVTVAAAATPQRSIRSYCSESGDLCFGVLKKDGAVFFDITTYAKYFSRYRLCVRGPADTPACRSFPVRSRGRFYGSSVRWNTNFPREGPGRYRVTWSVTSNRLGPTLSFTLPLARA